MTKNNDLVVVSFSQLSNWLECFHKHYLISIAKKISYGENEYFTYGRVVHDILEQIFSSRNRISDEEIREQFSDSFKHGVIELKEEKELDFKLIKKMYEGHNLIGQVYDLVEEKYPGFEVVGVEHKMWEPIEVDSMPDKDFFFTGYIDLIIEHEGKIYIIDYKTSMKGWSDYSKQDIKKTYQLPLYRHFYSKSSEYKQEDIIPLFLILNLKDQKVEEFKLENLEELQEKAVNDMHSMINAAHRDKEYRRTYGCYRPYCTCDDYYSEK